MSYKPKKVKVKMSNNEIVRNYRKINQNEGIHPVCKISIKILLQHKSE